jgi:hypothetical protein
MRAVVDVDADVNAERVIIMSRLSGEVYHMFKLTDKVRSFIVPYHHTLNSTLMVGIVDDDGEYNCSFLDGVIAESVNVNAL